MNAKHSDDHANHRLFPLPVLEGCTVDERLKQLKGWVLDNARLVKRFHFDNAVQALGFVTRLGAEAEARNHHPHVEWWKRDVRIELWTHKSNGATGLPHETSNSRRAVNFGRRRDQ